MELAAATAWVVAWTWIALHVRALRTRAASGGGESLWADAWNRLAKNRMAVISAWTIAVIGFACLFGPWVLDATYGIMYDAQNLKLGPIPPSWITHHWFGTDPHGRDVLVRVLVGGQISIAVGIVGGAVAATVGTTYGAISGYAGGKVDEVMMRIVEVLYALPFMLIVIVLGAVLGAIFDQKQNEQQQDPSADVAQQIVQVAETHQQDPSADVAQRAEQGAKGGSIFIVLFVAIGLVAWPTLARVVRGQVLGLKRREFVLAAHATGTSPWRIIRWHLIPNILGIAVVYTTLMMPSLVLSEAFLSYLGLGVRPPLASWGSLIADGATVMEVQCWRLVFPAAFMCVTLFAFNYLGDGLRDALDPKLRGVD